MFCGDIGLVGEYEKCANRVYFGSLLVEPKFHCALMEIRNEFCDLTS